MSRPDTMKRLAGNQWQIILAMISIFLLSSCSSAKSVSKPETQGHPTSAPPTSLIYTAGDENLDAFSFPDKTHRWQFHAHFFTGKGLLDTDTFNVYYVADQIYAFRAFDGKQLWTAPLAQRADAMTTDGDSTLYVASQGMIYALHTRDGSLLWRQNTLVAPLAFTSLVVQDQQLYATNGGTVFALDTQTGRLQWQYTAPQNDQIKTVQVSNNVLFVQSDGYIQTLNLQNGHVIWQRPSLVHSLAITNGTLYTTFEDSPSPTETSPNPSTKTGIRAINIATGKKLWQTDTPISGGVGAFDDTTLYWASGPTQGDLTAWNLKDGSRRWHQISNVNYQSLFTTNGLLIGETANGTLNAFQGTNGQAVWQSQHPLGELDKTQVEKNTIYITDTSGNLTGFNLRGQQIWQVPVGYSADQLIAE